MKYVLDASAVLALLNEEAGSERVEACLDDAAISAVNVVEVGTRLVDAGMPEDVVTDTLRLLAIPVVAFDARLAQVAIGLRAETRAFGLSLGDRACLALATQETAVALTSDKAWVQTNLGCDIELIR